MPINSRSKGASGEREFCCWLFEKFDLPKKPERNLEQVRSGGADVICKPFAFEVKRQEKLELIKWWDQVCRAVKNQDGAAFGLIPIVAYRQNGNKQWTFLIPSYYLQLGGDHGFIQLTERVFIKWVNKIVLPNEALVHESRYLNKEEITLLGS